VFGLKKEFSSKVQNSSENLDSANDNEKETKETSIFEKWKNSELNKNSSNTEVREGTLKEIILRTTIIINLIMTFSFFSEHKRKQLSSETDEENQTVESKNKKQAKNDPNERQSSQTHSPNKYKTKENSTDQILKGVVFALSGFQNPLRSELRDIGMKLGAKYRPDLTDDCNYLM
jgi:hypothetical protein